MGDFPNLANLEYAHRVNRAMDHVRRNLAEPLSLDDVAKVACFSPFHFHRVFKTVAGETLHDFVKRTRLERAVHILSHDDRPSLTDVAMACGFSSSSDFSRSFRAHFGEAPSAFDVKRFRVARQEQMRQGLPAGAGPTRVPQGANPDGFQVTIREVPPRRMAYVRVFRAYGGGVRAAVDTMMAWARARGLGDGQWFGYQWDDPEIVPMDKCRYDVGVEIPAGTVVEDPVSVVEFPRMTLAELPLAGPIELEMRALDWLYNTWLPSSGHFPDHQPVFEAWAGEPFAHGVEHFELRLQLPVVDGLARF